MLNSIYTPTEQISYEIQKMITYAASQRQNFERRWYDNNFFDDGYHFRYISRTTGRIIDTTDRHAVNLPQRAIPKASRQIRGIVNLLTSLDQVPVVYPKSVDTRMFMPDTPEYEAAKVISSDNAKKSGRWIRNQWNKQELKQKLILMMINAAKHGICYMQIWPDYVDETIRTDIYDAFEVYVNSSVYDLEDTPFIIKAKPESVEKLQANELFDPEQRKMLIPDNRYAQSNIKNAYFATRFGQNIAGDTANTIILKEAFIKEYLNETNYQNIAQKAGPTGAMEGKKIGDVMIRHTYVAGNTWLLDEYLDHKGYPFVDFRFEPGPLYQTPLIERFIPANKSLDLLVSRIERWANSMVVGNWLKKKGENFEINNIAGGNLIEYQTTPPIQGQMANVPAGIFDLISLTEKFIEEQGASTSALGALPAGVKSGVAIESVKATEFDNLKISSDMYKQTVKRITEKMMYLAGKSILHPQTVQYMEGGDLQEFQVLGQRGADIRTQQLGEQLPESAVVLDPEAIVDIETESGLGFTMEGRKETLQQITTFLTPFIDRQLLPPEALKVIISSVLKQYQYGATQDLMEAMEAQGGLNQQMTENQIAQMKVAIAETLKDLGIVGKEHDDNLINTTKVGVVEALKDTGMLNKQSEQVSASKEPSKSITFKDLPAEGKAQMAAQAGINLSPQAFEEQEDEQEEEDKDAVDQRGQENDE